MKRLLEKFRKPAAPAEPQIRQWKHDSADLPWLDKPDAAERIAAALAEGRITEKEAEQFRFWRENGYLVVRDLFTEEVLDRLADEISTIWEAEKPIPGLVIQDVRLVEGEIPKAMPHEEILAIPLEERLRIRDRSRYRIFGYHTFSDAAREIFESAELKKKVSQILGLDTPPVFSLTFLCGSEQYVHHDQLVFHIHPLNHLIGVWIPLEDVTPGCGELVYYPGSHREGIPDTLPNYPQTNLRTSKDLDEFVVHRDAMAVVAEKYEKKLFHPKKGETLLWHAMLLHGGESITDPGASRKSFVIHFIPEGMNRADEVVGPFLW